MLPIVPTCSDCTVSVEPLVSVQCCVRTGLGAEGAESGLRARDLGPALSAVGTEIEVPDVMQPCSPPPAKVTLIQIYV